ncbi:MAG: ABC transporter permease [Phycisphaerae bacterium]|nr:ABC transporter permease [Phycisphaerae bacterium]
MLSKGNAKKLILIFALFGVIVVFATSFFWAISDSGDGRRFERTNVSNALLPPTWLSDAANESDGDTMALFGTDQLGRDLLARCIVGGAISICVGLFAAFIAVFIGTAWGTIAGMQGGKIDAAMMRGVDILYGLPSIMLVVLITVAANSFVQGNPSLSSALQEFVNVVALLSAIGIVSWLTVSRVIRGQVRSLMQRPAMDACKLIGVGPLRTCMHHLIPALLGTIVVYATLTVPTAILSEAFLSFLGIGIREPLPSWGNLAADGLGQLNPVHSRWWLLFWPCICIAVTLVAMNWFGQSLRKRVDPRSQG